MAHTGIFGGTFNPIHNGHLHLLREAEAALQFDRIFLIPANLPPHKRAPDLAAGADRLAMARLAAASMENVFVSDIELKTAGKSYTILTLEKLHARFPDDRFTLLMGADMLLTFDRWYRWRDILALAGLAAFARSEGEQAALEQQAARFPNARIIRTTPLPLSSTAVRETLRAGGDVSAALPPAVAAYIQEKRLYR